MRWKFTENYDKTPLLSWIIISLKDTVNLNAKKKKNVNMTIKNITEIIITSTKLKKKQENNASGKFRQNAETPFSVGLGLFIQ